MAGNGDDKSQPGPEGAGEAAGGQERQEASGDVVDAVMAALGGDEDGGKSPEELDLEALARGDDAGDAEAGTPEAKAGGGEAGAPEAKAGGEEAGTPETKAGAGDGEKADAGGKAPGTAQDGAGEAQDKDAGDGAGQADKPPGDAQATGDAATGAEADEDLVTLDDLKVPDAFATIPDEAARAAVTAQWEKVARAVQYEFARANRTEDAYNTLAHPIREARASREQLTDAMAIIAGVNSGDPARLEQVDAYLVQMREQIAKTLGKTPPGEDALAGFPELAAAVEAGDMERKWAEELAAGRRAKGAAEARTRQQSEARQESDTAQQAIVQGAEDVRAFDRWLQANEPRYKELLPQLRRIAGRVEATVPPGQWMDSMIGHYQILRDVLDAAGPGAKGNGKAPPPRTQPLRTGATAGDAPRLPEPKTMAQAAAQAIFAED